MLSARYFNLLCETLSMLFIVLSNLPGQPAAQQSCELLWQYSGHIVTITQKTIFCPSHSKLPKKKCSWGPVIIYKPADEILMIDNISIYTYSLYS